MDTLSGVRGGVAIKERTEPKFVEFKKAGESVAGILIGIEIAQMENGKVPRYILEEGDLENGKFVPTGDRVCFLGAYNLNGKIDAHRDFGRFLYVRFEGEQPHPSKPDRRLKQFRVAASLNSFNSPHLKNRASDGTEITDDDIGF